MAKKALARVAELVSNCVELTNASEGITYRERGPSDQCLFQGTDEVGREGWFLRLEVTGMYTRRCGPFETREETLNILDEFASKVDEGFVDVMNTIHQPKQVLIVEGVPLLAAAINER